MYLEFLPFFQVLHYRNTACISVPVTLRKSTTFTDTGGPTASEAAWPNPPGELCP